MTCPSGLRSEFRTHGVDSANSHRVPQPEPLPTSLAPTRVNLVYSSLGTNGELQIDAFQRSLGVNALARYPVLERHIDDDLVSTGTHDHDHWQ